ncbi:hypothetical protein JCM16303_007324 [Sporobolomyces ruberrimus]
MALAAFEQALPDTFTARPTADQQALLQHRRDLALAHSLGLQHPQLRFKSLNLYPVSTATIPRGRDDSYASPNPQRPLDVQLLHDLEEANEGEELVVSLVEELQGGEDQWSQVWICDVDRARKTIGRVVVKFVAESLFPFPQDTWMVPGWYKWRPAREVVRKEAQAYAVFRETAQGTDVPWCYGFYRFDLPWGEEVSGILLEDLSDPENAQTVERCVSGYVEKKGEPQMVEEVDPLPTDILVFSTESANGRPHTLFLDFGESETKKEYLRGIDMSEADPACGLAPETLRHMKREWKAPDEHRLGYELYHVVGDVIWEWTKMEYARGEIGFYVE